MFIQSAFELFVYLHTATDCVLTLQNKHAFNSVAAMLLLMVIINKLDMKLAPLIKLIIML